MTAVASQVEWPGSDVLQAMIRGRFALAEGHSNQALRFFEEAYALQQLQPMTRFYEIAALPLARVLAEKQRVDEALALFVPVLTLHEQEETPGALMLAGDEIALLLRLALARDVHRNFASHVLTRIQSLDRGMSLSGGAAEATVDVPGTGETLTVREVEVLRLIAAGANNATIAATLVISLNTVKSHVANILGKLSVSSRTQAAIRARELGINEEP
jgi:LuxR family transcriptional regulator, maltose regulon positive regulatory protein